jgi:outer membrane murein-binding lipoprotein Lpp
LTDTQFYTLVAVPLTGILLNGALFVYVGGRVDKVAEKLTEIAVTVADLAARVTALEKH